MNTRPPSSHTLVIPDPPQPQARQPLRVSTHTPVGEIYIDRGQPLPDRYPGVRLQALIRDPGTVFVYWEPPEDLVCDGWVLVAKNANDDVLQVLRLPFDARQGYLYLAALDVATVSLYPAEGVHTQPSVIQTQLTPPDAPLITTEAPAASWATMWTGAWATSAERWAVLRPPMPHPDDHDSGDHEPPLSLSMPSPMAPKAVWRDDSEPMAGSGGGSGAWSGSRYASAQHPEPHTQEDGR